MARNGFNANFRSVALGAATLKTVVGIKAATNVALSLIEGVVSFDGAASSNAPAVVDFSRCTFATNGPGTNSTSVTVGKRDPGRDETVQATAGHTWTTEPTVLTVDESVDVAQYQGIYHYIVPFAAPIMISGGQGYVISITSPNVVNASGRLSAEE